MCFNAEISLATYVTGMAGAWLLYTSGKRRAEALFFAWVTHMQLIEFGLHLMQDPRYVRANKLLTRVGIFVNHMEPYILYAAIKAFETPAPSAGRIMDAMMLVLLPPTLYFSRKVVARDKDISPTTRGSGSRVCAKGAPPARARRQVCGGESTKLFWRWNYDENAAAYYALFVLALAVLNLHGFPGPRGRAQAAFAVASYAISYLLYRDEKAVGSMWCFIAAFTPWMLLAAEPFM